jgi:hypothetical protein
MVGSEVNEARQALGDESGTGCNFFGGWKWDKAWKRDGD